VAGVAPVSRAGVFDDVRNRADFFRPDGFQYLAFGDLEAFADDFIAVVSGRHGLSLLRLRFN